MKLPSGAALALVLLVGAGACASGGGGSAEGEEGIRPRDNTHTRTAQLLLVQAQSAVSEEEERQRYEAALEACLAGIEAEPENPQSRFQAAQAFLGLGDVVGADSMFTQAVEMYPSYEVEADALRESLWVEEYNRAIDPLNAGDLETALEVFERADAIYKGRPEAMLNLGSLHSRLGEPDQAVQYYQDAIALMTGPKFAQADSVTQADWTESLEIATYNLAQVLAQAGRNEEAVEIYSRYLESHPEDISVLSNMAIVLQGAGMPDSAAVIYDQLLARDDLTARDYFVTGIGLFQAEDFARSAVAFRKSLDIMPMSRDANYNLAQTLYLSEQFEALVPVAQRLVEIDPYNKNAYLLLAQALNRTGDDQAAVRAMEQREALPFEILDTEISALPAGGAVVSGSLTNFTLDEGTPVVVRWHFIDVNGQDQGTAEVIVPVPAPDQTTGFTAELGEGESLMGYFYEVVSP